MADSYGHIQSNLTPQGDTSKYKTILIPANQFNLNTSTDGSSLFPRTTTAGTVGELANLNSTTLYGFTMTDGEKANTNLLMVPDDMDVAAASYISVLWAPTDGTTTQGTTFVVLYTQYNLASATGTAATTPVTALNTVIVEDDENDTPFTLQKTADGVINASSLSLGNAIQFNIEADTVDGSSDIFLLGIVWKYQRKWV